MCLRKKNLMHNAELPHYYIIYNLIDFSLPFHKQSENCILTTAASYYCRN